MTIISNYFLLVPLPCLTVTPIVTSPIQAKGKCNDVLNHPKNIQLVLLVKSLEGWNSQVPIHHFLANLDPTMILLILAY